MKTFSLQAPAKINTRLKITGIRANGFHELDMIMVPLSFSDELTLTEIPSGIELQLQGNIDAQDANLQGPKNLAWRAAQLFLEHFHIKQGVSIQLLKRIPSGAGLGGGSSDAASVLLGLNQLWQIGAPKEELARLASQLGSDVPFFCYEQPCWVGGVGDQIRPIAKFPFFHVLLVKPSFSVATPWAYRAFDELHGLKAPANGVFQLTVGGAGVRGSTLFSTVEAVVQALENDLETAVFQAHPELANVKAQLLELGSSGSLMSGSGSVVFGIFADPTQLKKAAQHLQAQGFEAITTQVTSGKYSCA